jgi:hypothetical protein
VTVEAVPQFPEFLFKVWTPQTPDTGLIGEGYSYQTLGGGTWGYIEFNTVLIGALGRGDLP